MYYIRQNVRQRYPKKTTTEYCSNCGKSSKKTRYYWQCSYAGAIDDHYILPYDVYNALSSYKSKDSIGLITYYSTYRGAIEAAKRAVISVQAQVEMCTNFKGGI